LLRAAGAAREFDDLLTEEALFGLSVNPELRRSEDWLLTTQAVEVVLLNVPWSGRCRVAASEPEPAILQELAQVESSDAGPNLEPKYHFSEMKSAHGVLDVSLTPTTWRLGKNFHDAAQKYRKRFLRDGSRWLVPLPLGEARLPGLAAVHVIVLTADNRLLLAQRSAKVSYAPLHWSASFEEQVTEVDVCQGDRVFHCAAKRGMVEEFGIDVDPSRIHLISALLEMTCLNLGVEVLIDATQTFEQIRSAWSDKPSHGWEVGILDSTEADLLTLDALAGGAEFCLEPLVPTSRIRCALAARWMHWKKKG
jgi:hypothetical protein